MQISVLVIVVVLSVGSCLPDQQLSCVVRAGFQRRLSHLVKRQEPDLKDGIGWQLEVVKHGFTQHFIKFNID